MNLIVAGVSHKTAPVEVREKLSFSCEEVKASLSKLVQLPGIYEGILLSTCNRVEILFSAYEKKSGIETVKQFLADSHQLRVADIEPYLYFYTNRDAIRHIFRVASSLDSMIIGEPQILGQLKDAYRQAVECQVTGLILNRFLHKAFSVAKRVRTETTIASSAVSVSFAAVELARKIFDSLQNKRVLLIGAGEMAELVTRHLLSQGIQGLMIANRTFQHADNLAREFGGRAIGFQDIPVYLSQMDIVISSIGGSDCVITRDQAAAALKMRKNLPIFMVDISVPRTLDARINDLENAYLYDIDDLEGIIEINKEGRKAEATKAEEIIEEEITSFIRWLEQQEVTPTIVQLKEKVEHIRQQELAKTVARWNGLSDTEREALEALTSSLVNKILHDPITYLKIHGIKNGSSIETIIKLFNLSEGSSERRSVQDTIQPERRDK